MIEDKKYSVVMMVYLGDYPGAASNRELKFVRSVNSFIAQTYQNKELIIVADGCYRTLQLYHLLWEKKYPNIKVIWSPRVTSDTSKFYPGRLRQVGIENSTGDRITYLDSDDYIFPDRLTGIHQLFKDEWQYCFSTGAYLINAERLKTKTQRQNAHLEFIPNISEHRDCLILGNVGIPSKKNPQSTNFTGRIMAHARNINIKWQNVRSEDWHFMNELETSYVGADIHHFTYVICHNGSTHGVAPASWDV